MTAAPTFGQAELVATESPAARPVLSSRRKDAGSRSGALRGTSSLSDALADANIRLTHLKTKLVNAPKDVTVHSGFLGQYLALESQLDEYVRKTYGMDDESTEKTDMFSSTVQGSSIETLSPSSAPCGMGFDHELSNKLDKFIKSPVGQFEGSLAPVTEPLAESVWWFPSFETLGFLE